MQIGHHYSALMTGGNAKQKISYPKLLVAPKGQNKPAGQRQRQDCAPLKVLGLSTQAQVVPSMATDHAIVPAFHLFWSTSAFSSLFTSIDRLPANTLWYML